MDNRRFEDLVRTLAARPSRRDAVRALVGLALGGTLAAGLGDAAGKKRKKKRKQRKREQVAGACSFAGGAPPPIRRIEWAQTFVAQRSGRLTRVRFVLAFNAALTEFGLGLFEVDAGGAPSARLAGGSFGVVPAIDAAGPPRVIEGIFDDPAAARVVAGQRYALMVGALVNTYSLLSATGDPCPDQAAFARGQGQSWAAQPLDLAFVAYVAG